MSITILNSFLKNAQQETAATTEINSVLVIMFLGSNELRWNVPF